jgi:hypothetical protein
VRMSEEWACVRGSESACVKNQLDGRSPISPAGVVSPCVVGAGCQRHLSDERKKKKTCACVCLPHTPACLTPSRAACVPTHLPSPTLSG